MYYNRARWYDTTNGRFNRVDPYSGNRNDPQSLHKYLYMHNNPVNGIDPSGREFSIGGLVQNMAIRMVAFNAWATPYVNAAKPFIKAAFAGIVAYDIYQGISAGAEVSAFTLGASGNMPFVLGLGAFGGLDMVVGRNTGAAALFGIGGLSTNHGGSVSPINIGLAFNTPSSQSYEGRGRAVSLSFGMIPSNIRSIVKNKMVTFLPKLQQAILAQNTDLGNFLAQMSPQLVSRLSSAVANATTRIFNGDSSVTLWGGGGNSFGISFAPGFPSLSGGDDKITASYGWYEQVAPEDDDGRDVDVRF